MKKRWRIILLIIWIVGILFPFFYIRRFSRVYKTWFNWAFKSDITHIVMHLLLYAVLAWLISIVFSNKKKPISPVKVILIVLGVSILQEAIQLALTNCPVEWDEIFDILINVSGAGIGLFVFRWKWVREKRDVKRV